jgi:ubiquinone/menaquinone biosynthesis C-methylase UbiE
MENPEEAIRLDIKTNRKRVEQQALWAGIKPGMRVADLGCGSGKTTSVLNSLCQPNGQTYGVDISKQRISYAQEHYPNENIDYLCRDIREPLDDLGQFDFIWIRFVLEYYKSKSFDIVKNITSLLNPGGTLALIDLDYNCLTYYGFSRKVEKTICEVMKSLEKKAGFDPYVGRKLYSYLYDLGFDEIDVDLSPHHLIFGKVKERDLFNWTKKVEVAGRKSGHFKGHQQKYQAFYKEFIEAFKDERRFIYTPVVICKGIKR